MKKLKILKKKVKLVDRNFESVLQMIIFLNKGGSHEIATSITDLYGAAFRTDLVSWLKSIPYFPKPFDMVFEPITSLMYHLLDDLVAGDCYQAENLKVSFCFTSLIIIHYTLNS